MPVADKVVVELELKDGQYLSRVRANGVAFDRAMDRTGDAAERAQKRVQASSAGIASSLRSAAGAIAAGAGVAAITGLADSYTRYTNQLKLAGLEGESLERTQNALFATAQKYGVELEALGGLYGRTSQGAKELGASNAELLQFTNGVAAALKIQGGSAADSSGAILQLTQALGGAVVRAEEFNSINEGARPILQAVADNIDRFGGSVSKLRAEVIDGKVTSQEFFQAFLKGTSELETKAGKSILTIGASLQVLNNALGRYIGDTDSSLSATERFSQAIRLLADNLDTIIPAITALVVLVGGRFAIAMTTAAVQTGIATVNAVAYQLALARMAAAQTGATTAQVLLNAAMTANPIGIIVTAVAALAAGLFLLAQRYNTTAVAARELDAVTSAADTAISDYAAAVLEAKNASGQERVELLAKAEALREVTRARINDARVAAQRQIDEAVAARGRADDAIRAAGDTSRSVGTNAGTNAGAALVGGARSRAQGAIDLAVRARGEANRGIAAFNNLKRAAEQAQAGVSPGGGGGGTSPGGAVGRIAAAATEVDNLREELARVQESQLTDAEKAAAELAETIAIIKAAQKREYITPQDAAILTAGAAGQNIVNEARSPLTSALDISGRDIARDLREGDQEQQQRYREQGAEIATSFIDILRSGNIGEEIGLRFADAAFNSLQQALTGIFAGLLQNGGQAGGIVSGLGSFFGFGGGRAMGGPVRKGFSYDVGESGREKFIAPANGFIMPNMGATARTAGAQRVDVRQTFVLEGVNGDQAIYSNVQRLIAQGQRQTLAIVRDQAGNVQSEQRLLRD